MTTAVSPQTASAQAVVLPKNRGAYYDGAWHEPKAGRFVDTISPGTGQSLGKVADSGAEDIDAAVATAKTAFAEWRRVLPLERAKILRWIVEILRQPRLILTGSNIELRRFLADARVNHKTWFPPVAPALRVKAKP